MEVSAFLFKGLQLKIFCIEFRKIRSYMGLAPGGIVTKAAAFVQLVFFSVELAEDALRTFPRRGKKAVPALGIFLVVP